MSQVDVVVGTVGRAHGLRGELVVQVRSDFADERFAPGAELRRDTVDGAPLRVVRSRWQSGTLIVAFEGVGDRSRAETLRGTDLWARVEATEDSDGGIHDAALVGLDVRSGGVSRGRVIAVTHNPAQDLLVVETREGERLVPFVAELVPQVDLAGGYVEVVALPGLLEEA